MTPPRPFLLVGLTGGIATGKSTVANLLRDLGAEIIDADVLAREVVEPGEPALDEIVAEFGRGVLEPTGRLDRKALGAIMFADPERRRKLEAITHPRIREGFQRRLDALAARDFRGLVFFDAAVMIESGNYRNMDRLVVVVADEPTQIARLMARDGIGREEALRKIASQMPLADKAKLADYVIDNSGDRLAAAALTERVFRALARECASSWRLVGRAAPLAVLFPSGMGIYKQQRRSPAEISERLRRVSPMIDAVAYHWRPSGDFLVEDPGVEALSMVATSAEQALGLAIVARRFPQLQQLEWAWPTDFVSPLDPIPGTDIRVAVMLSMAVPEGHRISGRLRSRIEVVRWVSAQDVLCLYRRPLKNGSLGHVSTAVLAALNQRSLCAERCATARSMSVVAQLLDGTMLQPRRD